MPVYAIITIIALVGGGTSFAAERSLPGDILYPVKVNVNEQVAAAFHFSTEAKANWEAGLAERRLEEAAELAAEGRLNARAKAEVEDRFEAFADRVEARIKNLEAKGEVRAAADVSSRFETALRAHEKILNRLEAKTSDEVDAQLEPIEVKVHARLGDILGLRLGLEGKIASSSESGPEVKAAAEGKVNAAENVITSAKAVIERANTKFGAQATANAEARLKIADNLVVQAKAKIDGDAYGEAFNLGNQAIRVAQEARTLIEARTELKVDIDLEDSATGSGICNSCTYEQSTSSIQAPDVKLEGGSNASGTLKVEVGF